MERQADDVWKELIIEHSQFPRGHRALEAATHEARGENPFCGDQVTVQLSVDRNGYLEAASCQSVGCAISIASASLLAQHLPGKTSEQALRLFEQVHELLTTPQRDGSELGELSALQLVKNYPSRVKCASLAWHTFRAALNPESGQTVTTESD